MNNLAPIIKKEIANTDAAFDWQFGKKDTNIILENTKLNVKLLRYIITLTDGKFLYDTFAIKESKNRLYRK